MRSEILCQSITKQELDAIGNAAVQASHPRAGQRLRTCTCGCCELCTDPGAIRIQLWRIERCTQVSCISATALLEENLDGIANHCKATGLSGPEHAAVLQLRVRADVSEAVHRADGEAAAAPELEELGQERIAVPEARLRRYGGSQFDQVGPPVFRPEEALVSCELRCSEYPAEGGKVLVATAAHRESPAVPALKDIERVHTDRARVAEARGLSSPDLVVCKLPGVEGERRVQHCHVHTATHSVDLSLVQCG
mmetsp:Transcript_137996/g.384926  ORF Transcript_137996/g.384926 Transcript_137996/m.384926 type:complete len:252 (+) Transcript_137996:168-923(+)